MQICSNTWSLFECTHKAILQVETWRAPCWFSIFPPELLILFPCSFSFLSAWLPPLQSSGAWVGIQRQRGMRRLPGGMSAGDRGLLDMQSYLNAPRCSRTVSPVMCRCVSRPKPHSHGTAGWLGTDHPNQAIGELTMWQVIRDPWKAGRDKEPINHHETFFKELICLLERTHMVLQERELASGGGRAEGAADSH